MREGLAAQYGERTTVQKGRAAAKQAAYNATLSARSSYTARLSRAPRAVAPVRVAG